MQTSSKKIVARKFLLILSLKLIALNSVYAQESNDQWKMIIQELSGLNPRADMKFQEEFNQTLKNAETWIDQEKLRCKGDVISSVDKLNSKSQKQICFKDLKNKYTQYIKLVFATKQKLLKLIHQNHLKSLEEKLDDSIKRFETDF